MSHTRSLVSWQKKIHILGQWLGFNLVDASNPPSASRCGVSFSVSTISSYDCSVVIFFSLFFSWSFFTLQNLRGVIPPPPTSQRTPPCQRSWNSRSHLWCNFYTTYYYLQSLSIHSLLLYLSSLTLSSLTVSIPLTRLHANQRRNPSFLGDCWFAFRLSSRSKEGINIKERMKDNGY